MRVWPGHFTMLLENAVLNCLRPTLQPRKRDPTVLWWKFEDRVFSRSWQGLENTILVPRRNYVAGSAAGI